jgi:hemerythrin-like metal-binding protein
MPTPTNPQHKSEEQMELFKWHNTYSVNNEDLDTHHKRLFNILNKLYENCISTDIPNSLDPIVDELVSYSIYHISVEEKHMRDIGYKEIDKQISEHRSFIQRTLRLQQVVDKNDLELTKELIVFLGNWILKHVIDEDKKISV